MSRYLLLIILNLSFVLAGILNATVAFKLKRIGKKRFTLRLIIWLSILIGIVFAEPLYLYLFTNNLTQTEPLSLFDVIQITGIVAVLFIANLAYNKVTVLEKRVQDLHQELSIRISDDKK